MKSQFAVLTAVLALALMAVMSCAGGAGTGNPASPQMTPERPSQAGPSGHQLLAYLQIYVEPEEGKVEIVPLREVDTHWNVLKFLEQGPCTTCVAVKGINPTPDGTIEWTVEIRHPFPVANLTGFDVRGIAMFKGSRSYPASALTTPDRAQGDGELVNPDGYTTLYNSTTQGSGPGGLQGYLKGKYGSPLIPDALVNGYKSHISAGAENTRNAMYAGDAITAVYELDMPDTGFYFNYAVDANWVPPTTKPVTDPMTDFPPEANCSEPWKVDVYASPINGGMTPEGGETQLVMNVYDWQGKDSHGDPVVECPELFDGELPATWVSDGIGFTNYEVTISNAKLADLGEYEVLISVEDNDNATAPAWLDLTAYQILAVSVVEPVNAPPVAGAAASSTNARPWLDVQFYDASTDPDGASDIVAWEWDFSYDEVDGFQVESTEKIAVYQFPGEGVYQVQHRVRDLGGLEDMLDTPLEVTVERVGWGVSFGGIASEECLDLGVGASFETYVVGVTDGTIDLDPGSGIVDYTSQGGSDFFITVLDSSGAYMWGHGWGSTGEDFARSVTPTTSGKVLVTGSFTGTVDFDPGPSTDERTSNGGSEDAFLLVLNSDGSFNSVLTWGGTGYEGGESVDYDNPGNTYVAGNFSGTVDFDPGAGVTEMTSVGASDVFLCKYNPAGAFQWVKTFGGPQADWLFDLCIERSSGECFLVGYFQDTVDFNPGPPTDNHTSNGDWDVFACKLNKEGGFQWAATWGGTGRDQAKAAGVDGCYNLSVVGGFEDTVDFDPGSGTDDHSAQGLYTDVFLSLLDSSTGAFRWAKTWGAVDAGDTAEEVCIQSMGPVFSLVFVTGSFFGTVDFDPGLDSAEKTSAGLSDVFTSAFESFGAFMWVSTWGGDDEDSGTAIGTDMARYLRVGGHFSSTMDLDPSPGEEFFTSEGGYDLFVSKLATDGWW